MTVATVSKDKVITNNFFKKFFFDKNLNIKSPDQHHREWLNT